MSKTIDAPLQDEYDNPASNVVTCLKITRTDGVVRRFTSHDRTLNVFSEGADYEPGFDLSSLSSSSTLSVDNLELTIIPEDDETLYLDLISGRYDNAAFVVFETTWVDSENINVLKTGHMGEVQFKDSHFVVEFRSLTQMLQQTQADITSKTCRARLGDARCRINLPALQVSGTLDAVSSAISFVDAARTEVADYFGEGIITITSGDNAGIRRRIVSFSGGAFLVDLPFPFLPVAGDTYTATPGCRKRHFDCKNKFSNVVNFQGEPHLPGIDALTRKTG